MSIIDARIGYPGPRDRLNRHFGPQVAAALLDQQLKTLISWRRA